VSSCLDGPNPQRIQYLLLKDNKSCSDSTSVSAFLWIVESCKRMANVVVRCGKKEHIRSLYVMGLKLS